MSVLSEQLCDTSCGAYHRLDVKMQQLSHVNITRDVGGGDLNTSYGLMLNAYPPSRDVTQPGRVMSH
jgi:hypothetical protein